MKRSPDRQFDNSNPTKIRAEVVVSKNTKDRDERVAINADPEKVFRALLDTAPTRD